MQRAGVGEKSYVGEGRSDRCRAGGEFSRVFVRFCCTHTRVARPMTLFEKLVLTARERHFREALNFFGILRK